MWSHVYTVCLIAGPFRLVVEKMLDVLMPVPAPVPGAKMYIQSSLLLSAGHSGFSCSISYSTPPLLSRTDPRGYVRKLTGNDPYTACLNEALGTFLPPDNAPLSLSPHPCSLLTLMFIGLQITTSKRQRKRFRWMKRRVAPTADGCLPPSSWQLSYRSLRSGER